MGKKGAMAKPKINPYALLQRIRRQQPVVHHLTKWVTIYDCANVVKVLGASPVMAHAREEVAEMTEIAAALVLNIGRSLELVEAMKWSALSANGRGIPVVLDVCGAAPRPCGTGPASNCWTKPGSTSLKGMPRKWPASTART